MWHRHDAYEEENPRFRAAAAAAAAAAATKQQQQQAGIKNRISLEAVLQGLFVPGRLRKAVTDAQQADVWRRTRGYRGTTDRKTTSGRDRGGQEVEGTTDGANGQAPEDICPWPTNKPVHGVQTEWMH